MKRFLLWSLLILNLCFAAANPGHKPPRTRSIEKVRTEQKQTKRAIAETGKQINENTRHTESQLAELDRLRDKSAVIESEIARRRALLDSLSRKSRRLTDSIGRLEKRVEAMQQTFVKAIRATQGNRTATDRLTFIFSAHTFKEAWRRYRYLGEFAQWQKVKSQELRSEVGRLDSVRSNLVAVQQRQQQESAQLDNDRRKLDTQQEETRRIVAELRSRGGELRKVLQQNEQRARELDHELDRLIAAEQARIEKERREREAREKAAREKAERQRLLALQKQREEAERKSAAKSGESRSEASAGHTKPETTPAPPPPPSPSITETERKLTGDFASNKGRLLFPVGGSHRIVRGFGRQPHPDMPNVTTENNGIDISTAAGSSARAIFNGRVASIMQYPGCNNIVIVRHGDYYAVYSNIATVAVKVGDNVSAGQRIGTIFTDPEKSGGTILHFELRHGSTKLNPTLWVK